MLRVSHIWSTLHEFFLLAVVFNRYPNLIYVVVVAVVAVVVVVVVVVVDDADEMVTYGDNYGPNR